MTKSTALLLCRLWQESQAPQAASKSPHGPGPGNNPGGLRPPPDPPPPHGNCGAPASPTPSGGPCPEAPSCYPVAILLSVSVFPPSSAFSSKYRFFLQVALSPPSIILSFQVVLFPNSVSKDFLQVMFSPPSRDFSPRALFPLLSGIAIP